MSDRRRSTIAAGLTTFLLAGTAAQGEIALLYHRGVSRVQPLHGIDEPRVRVLARPIRILPGEAFSRTKLAAHLRSIGYYEGCVADAGCYTSNDQENALTIWARHSEFPNLSIHWSGDVLSNVVTTSGIPLDEALVEPETLLVLTEYPLNVSTRTSYDYVPLSAVKGTPLLDAILASEDRRFFTHHGLDFARLALAPLTRHGASTITMQVGRLNVLQDRSRTLSRKLNEIGVAMAMERVFPKDAILAAYINSVGVGARGGRPIRGFGAASREFFGVGDVRRLNQLQAATLVALLNQPSRYLDGLSGGNDARLRRQRNRVLWLMHLNFPYRYAEPSVRMLMAEPVALAPDAARPNSLLRVSRHFVGYALPGAPPVHDGRVYLTLDPGLQRLAVDAIEEGLDDLSQHGPRRAGLQAALIATDPRTGDVLAMVGGRSYDESQLNRAVTAHRQIGSLMKPFDYLAAFERAAEKQIAVSPATTVVDQPAVFTFPGLKPWRPANYNNSYAGTITWRRALAESRNVAAVKVATMAGINRVAALWESASGGPLPHVFPSIALGAVEASAADVATAYGTFANGGVVHPLRAIAASIPDGQRLDTSPAQPPRTVAAKASADVVAGMMRAVVDEGTGRGARAAGFTRDAAGKTGTTNGLRDAWFAGFSGNLLAVVWVGYDDGVPVGLTGAQAALPIWTAFMKRALH